MLQLRTSNLHTPTSCVCSHQQRRPQASCEMQANCSEDCKESHIPLPFSSGVVDVSGVHELIFRGLAVRMVIASGKIEACAKHAVTHRTEYIGEPILRTPCAQLSGLHSTAISNPAAAVSESSTTSLTTFFHGRALPSSVYDDKATGPTQFKGSD